MGPARSADQMAGCSRADAEHVFAQAAALHAPRWGDPRLAEIGWLNTRHPTSAALAAGLAENYGVFRERYEHLVAPDHIAVGEKYCAAASRLAGRGPRQTIIHGDYRLDNMLFDAQGGAVPLVVLDWQSVGVANSGADTAYFMATSYPIEHRRRDERELLLFYHEQMRARGVRDYGWDDRWEDYRRGTWVAMITAIAVSALSKQTERGDRMFVRMFQGAAAQMLDLDSLALA